MEPTAIEHVHPDSTQEDIEDLYQDIYQLQRLPRTGQCKEANKECLHKEILHSIKECFQLKQLSIQPEEEWRQFLADIPQPDPCTEFGAANHHKYEEFTATKQDLYEGMMAIARDAH